MLMAKKGGRTRRSFVSLEDYFLYGKEQDIRRDAAGERLYRPDLVAHWSRGVSSDVTAGLEMEAVAGKSRANEANPLLHFVISTRPGEVFSEEQARVAVDAAMRSLGADRSHAYKAATHYDVDDGRYHTHVMANRRSTRTGKLLDMHNDYFKFARAAEWCEREFGLQVDRKPDWRKKVSDRDLGMEVERAPERERADLVKRSWETVVEHALPAMKVAQTWEDVHAALRPFGAEIRERGSGFVIVGPERDHTVKLSALGPLSDDAVSARELRERLGGFVPSEPAPAVDKAKAPMAAADVVAAKAAIIAANPDMVIDDLAQTRSTWTREDVDREVAAKLGVKFAQREQHKEVFDTAAAAVLSRSEPAAKGDDKTFTTRAIRTEEDALFAAAEKLYNRHGGPRLRDPSADLTMAQQKNAYAHLASDRALANVTGIAGAGKSRSSRDYCAAEVEAGRRVIGTTCSGDAALTLADEAKIETRNLAQLLSDLRPGPDGAARDRLTKKTTIVVDEAQQVGSEQCRELLEMVAAVPGARIRFFGDVEQHGSVGRGAPFRGLVETFGAVDMAETMRAKHEHLREVAVAMRAGRVSTAYDVLRDHSHLHGYATPEEALASRAAGYVSSLKADRTALLIPTSNADCLTLSLQVRAALPERLGEERDYATAFGKRTFAVGELVQAREPNREASRSVNRDRFTVVAHRDDGRLDLERERDGQRVTWNLTEKPRLEYGWACTSYSATGKTVDDVWALQAGNRKVAYGDVTRARERVSIAFTGDFGRMMAEAQRDSRKTLVRDAVACASAAGAATRREQSFARAKTIAAGQREQREAAERAIVEAAARAAAVVVAQREAQARAEAVAAEQRAQREAAERAQQEAAAARALVERQRQREVIEKARRAAQERAEAQRQAKAARVAQRSPEEVKRGFAAENIGHFYVFEEEVVHGKDGNEYTIAEGWYNVIGKISLDGDTLNKAVVSFSAESDDGTKVRVPREMDLLELAEGVESESVEISEQYQPLFEAAVERAAEAQLQQDYSQVSSIRFALEHSGGMSKRDCPTDESIMKRLPELRERATTERDPWKYESENDTIARIIRDELGRGRSQSRGMGR
jgi:flagellar biosynthesis GTPase FlhF